MQPDNISATASYINDVLEGLEESITDEATPSQYSMSSATSEMKTNHASQHVYIGKAPRETTVGEMNSLLYTIDVKDTFDIKRVSKYNHHGSFCVTLQDSYGIDNVFEHP